MIGLFLDYYPVNCNGPTILLERIVGPLLVVLIELTLMVGNPIILLNVIHRSFEHEIV
ncbi:hypothetical protein ACIQD3_13365 [Peribacillus loiseleuriae]|uniref:hypothetical protein n=1 Tax=Peribacillus loiseleuriae TaxID=1679170 RepID=UPI0038099B26